MEEFWFGFDEWGRVEYMEGIGKEIEKEEKRGRIISLFFFSFLFFFFVLDVEREREREIRHALV